MSAYIINVRRRYGQLLCRCVIVFLTPHTFARSFLSRQSIVRYMPLWVTTFQSYM